LQAALQANGPGALGGPARKLTRDKALWVVSFANPAIAVGTVWNMINKPDWTEAILVVAAGYAIGAALALAFSRAPAVEAPAAPEPAA
jgi:hypothetical protein